jgi:CcmD family protein
MTTFLVAYAAVWLLVSLYVLRLGTRQRELQRRLESLQSQLEQTTAGDADSSALGMPQAQKGHRAA